MSASSGANGFPHCDVRVIRRAGDCSYAEGARGGLIDVLDHTVFAQEHHRHVQTLEDGYVSYLLICEVTVAALKLENGGLLTQPRPLRSKADLHPIEESPHQVGARAGLIGVLKRLTQIRIRLRVVLHQRVEHRKRYATGAVQARLSDTE
ncbi:MAG: hypothetical protein CVT59_10645 [Actinobacteria bacterium HGW-Actinobacteria-1]|nr:MAG: hypothetical protein CVT59_10645 [Actinobacteria bacterium HGW-Actinobacteria-1]